MENKYDLVIIGGGPGGLAAAELAATMKKSVLIIEKDGWGGTCANRGCIPIKTLLTSSKFYADLKKLKRVGVNISSAAVDFSAMKKHQEQMVKVAALGAHKILADAQVETKQGTGEIISPQEVQYRDQESNNKIISTKNIVIAWGSQPQMLPETNLTERILTSDGLLNLDNLPASIIIVGGSVIGVEFATFFAELGTKVTLVELLDRILPYEDQEAADLLRQELSRLGIDIHASTKLESLNDNGSKVVMQAEQNNNKLEMTADYALLCTGRQPVLYEAELNKLEIQYSKTGIKVDKNMMTNVAGIYAVGDVTGGLMLAHRATLQGKIAAGHICESNTIVYNENFIPSVVYSHPQIARVGLIQKSADVQVIKSNYSANITARTELMSQGFVKAFFHNDKIIGATIVGDDAADLIAPLSLAVSNELTKKQLRSWVIAHPTLSEIFTALIGG